jgi:tetratricopeptide (TPR) repeat protein
MPALLIFLVALAVRLVHIWQLRGTPFFDTLLGDANGYDKWAVRLASGDWIGSDVFYQAPLYPYFLGVVYAIFGRDLLIVRIVQAAIGSASCVLLGLACTRLFSKRVGLVAGLALALWAPAIFFDSLLQKAVLDMFFMCLTLWLLAGIEQASWRRWVGLGCTLAALALTRENALLLIAVVAVWIVLRPFYDRATDVLRTDSSIVEPPRNIRRTYVEQLLMFAAGLILVFTPVVARNYSVDGGFYLTTSQFGSNFYIGNNPNADGTYASIRFGRGAPEFERLDAKEVAEESVGHALSPSEVSSFWAGRAFDYITSQPVAWLKLTGRKVLLLFNRTEMLDTEAQESYAEVSTPLKVLGWVGHFGVLMPLAIAGVIATWPDRRRLSIVYALAIAYAASVVMFFVFARYRYALVPFLILFAVAPFDPFDSKQRSFRTLFLAQGKLKWWPLAAVIAVAIFANWRVLSPTLMMSITENNLGTALAEKGRYDEAIARHERSISLRPDYAPAYNNLGAALRGAGRLDEAIARYQQALALKPDFASASYNLANAQLEQGKAGDSVASFRRSLDANPNSVEAHNNLGIALANRGDRAAAIAEFRAALAVDDRSVHAHRNLGNMLIDAGQRAEGMAHLERAADLAPSEPEAVYDIGTVLLQDQRFAAAAAQFEAALKIRPDWAEAHNNLGIALASQGRIADALRHFERAVALNPSLNDARANRDQALAEISKKK